tara:strand:+ start:301 stop:780 length:480 start_codon:yes stop_codon:yes gene_type:complete
MAKNFLKSDPFQEVEQMINNDFNVVIRKIHGSLSTKTHSPTWTGFFASSWKVQNSPVKPMNDVMKYNPWAKIKRKNQRKRPSKPHVKARFPVKKTYDIKKSVYIGNRAKYAAYALEGGKLQNFIQGRLGKIIKDNMKEKRGKLYLLGAPKSNVGYGDVL